jgi:predicted nucleic acid-binding protein
MTKLFFDTYAFVEVLNSNPNYLPYTKDTEIITTQLNLMELYYHLRFSNDTSSSSKLLSLYEELAIPFSTQTIIEAMEFRKANKHKKLSYADSLGYTIAKKHKALFLTGDKEFKGMQNVLFVK